MYHINKLGGTAVGNYKYYKNIYNIAQSQLKYKKPIFVVSAINPINKDLGTTSQLINIYNKWNIYKKCSWDDMKYYEGPFKNLINSHLCLERDLDLLNTSEYRNSEDILKENIETWKKNYKIISLNNELKYDNFIYLGELLSANILTGFLNKNNLKSQTIDLSNLMINHDINISNFNNRANIIEECKNLIPLKINNDNNKYDKHIIPVFTGYFGFGGKGTYSILGRGYTDATSSIISSTLDSPLTVWKESGGVFTGHPFKLQNTKQIDKVTLNEAIELTSFGNDVIHPLTSQFTKDYNINVDICDIRDLNDKGTEIINNFDQVKKSKLVTAISVKDKISIVTVNLDNGKSFDDVLNKISNYNPFLVSITNSTVSFALDKKYDIGKIPKKLNSLGNIKILENRCCISCIGEGMKKQLGTTSKIFKELASIGVNIEMIAQGPEEINISVIVDNKNVWKSVQLLHDILI